MRNVYVLLMGLLLVALTAGAAPITFDFVNTGSFSGSGVGNSYTTTSGGVTVTATAWTLIGGSFQPSQIFLSGSFGLGVCNSGELVGGCTPFEGYVDNENAFDYILFQFSGAVDPLTITLDPVIFQEMDNFYWTGTATNPLNLTGVTVGGLAGLGFTNTGFNDNVSGFDPVTLPINSPFVNSMLFGPEQSSNDDKFKVAAMTVNTPEPATLSLVGGVLIALGVLGRRRRAKK
jgi:hypothetical protein